MNLLLFHIDDNDFFVAGKTKRGQVRHSSSSQTSWDKVKTRIRRTYESIRRRFDYQENVCSALRHATTLTVAHPRELSKGEARKRFNEFLDYRQSKHRRWLLIDASLAVMGGILTPLPGPNVFFLYPAARALSHYFALKGARKARRTSTVEFREESAIDRIHSHLNNLDNVGGEIRELERRYELRDLRRLLRG
jgi:hypothetical protein